MIVLPGIRLDTLKEQSDTGPIKGDVHIFYKRGRDGQWQPYVMHLYRLHSNGEIGVTQESEGRDAET